MHLQPVRWEDGWPLMGIDQDGNGVGEPVARHPKPDVGRTYPAAVPQSSDEFGDVNAGGKLGLQWQWQANHYSDWHSLTERPGWLRLFAEPLNGGTLAEAGNLLMQKFPARAFSVRTRMEFSPEVETEMAGLAVMGLEHGAIVMRQGENGMEIGSIVNGQYRGARGTDWNTVELQAVVEDGGECSLDFRINDEPFENVARFQAKEGVWIGAKIGVFVVDMGVGQPAGGHADFDYFRFGPPGWGVQ